MELEELKLAKFEIAKLDLKENDLLVFRYLQEPEPEDVECLLDSILSVLPKNVTALIMSDGIEITRVRKIDEESTLD